MTSKMDVEDLIEAASNHGDEESESEVNDLQAMLRACWELMDTGQKRDLLEEFSELLSEYST